MPIGLSLNFGLILITIIKIDLVSQEKIRPINIGRPRPDRKSLWVGPTMSHPRNFFTFKKNTPMLIKILTRPYPLFVMTIKARSQGRKSDESSLVAELKFLKT